MTQVEIARMYGVSPTTVSYHKRQGGAQFRSPREAAMESFPWPEMDKKFKTGAPYQRVTWHLEYAVSGGRGMTPYKSRELRNWYEKLAKYNVVLEFDPNLAPHPGVLSGGWQYAPRRESDGNLLIRENAYTTLTDESREIWRIPDELPSV
ncbi:MAG: hypothetical protein ABIN01_21300 [Ferruginibacter sp.]